jgi:hypothetical protein
LQGAQSLAVHMPSHHLIVLCQRTIKLQTLKFVTNAQIACIHLSYLLKVFTSHYHCLLASERFFRATLTFLRSLKHLLQRMVGRYPSIL